MTAMSYTEVTLPPSNFESELTLSPINSAPPPLFHAGTEGRRRCEIDEGVLVKMPAGDHWSER